MSMIPANFFCEKLQKRANPLLKINIKTQLCLLATVWLCEK